MAHKHLKDKEKVFENWLNPVLPGTVAPGTSLGLTSTNYVEQPQSNINRNPEILEDPPAWLLAQNPSDVKNGDILSIGFYLINGQPITTFGTIAGSAWGYTKKNIMNNWHAMPDLFQKLFPNGVNLNRKKNVEDLVINDVVLQKISPAECGLGVNIYLRFKLGENDVWCKFVKWGLGEPKFICEELVGIDKEQHVKIVGKLKNLLADFFTPAPGIYKCLAKDVIIHTELGQISRLVEGDVIEVIKSDNDKITFTYQEKKFYVKKPTYYWFNYYFVRK